MNRERIEAKVSDREALAAALSDNAVELSELVMPESRHKWLRVVLAAARERLAQLPEKCGTCDGTGWIPVESDDPLDDPCPPCHGSGKVYPAELVERIARVIQHRTNGDEPWPTDAYEISEWLADAVAVLDALNGETE